MTKKILKNKQYGFNRTYNDLEGSMDKVIKNLSALLLEVEKLGYTNITMNWSHGYSSDDIDWFITGDRLETDTEYNARLKIEKRLAEQRKKEKITRDQNERKEYERLKKKFENKK